MTRQTLVLIPGLLCDATVWAAQAQALKADFDLVIPDLRDFDSLEAMARSVLALAPETMHLVGHSMGGRVAFEIMRFAPERARSLVVLDTGVHPPGADEPARRQKFLDIAAAEGTAGVGRAWIPMMIHPARRRDLPLVDAIARMVGGYTADQFRGQIRALLGRRDLRPLLADIACPTLVVVGRQDGWAPVCQHEDIAAAIPGAELVIVEESGHMVTMERPAEVSRLLADWLARNR